MSRCPVCGERKTPHASLCRACRTANPRRCRYCGKNCGDAFTCREHADLRELDS